MKNEIKIRGNKKNSEGIFLIPKEHQKFSFENFLKKIFERINKRIEKMSDIDEDKFKQVCDLAGIPYGGMEDLKQHTYKRLNAMRESLEARQEELNAQLKDITQQVEAISHSLMLIERAEEAKLQADIERLKEGLADTSWLEELEKELEDN